MYNVLVTLKKSDFSIEIRENNSLAIKGSTEHDSLYGHHIHWNCKQSSCNPSTTLHAVFMQSQYNIAVTIARSMSVF